MADGATLLLAAAACSALLGCVGGRTGRTAVHAPVLDAATASRVADAVRDPAGARCDALVAGIAADERLQPAAASLLAQSLTLHAGTVVRWAGGRPPIRVWVQPSRLRVAGRPAGDEPAGTSSDALDRAARDAANDWDGAAPSVRLLLVNDSSAAEIVIVWTRRLAARSATPGRRADARSGVLRNAQTGAIEGAVVTLANEAPDGARRSPRDVHALAIHEVGHALGLAHPAADAGHASGGPTSIMAAHVVADEITPADRAALRAWYSLPLGRLCQPGGSP